MLVESNDERLEEEKDIPRVSRNLATLSLGNIGSISAATSVSVSPLRIVV